VHYSDGHNYVNLGHLLTWQNYHRIEDINGYLDYLATTYPNIVQVISIGNSIEGRPINLVKISSSTTSAATPAFFIDGGRFITLHVNFYSIERA
jgi:hypothetical protein